ncbi:hypothetical protein OKA04_08605 [Luteolibacter flavescens]|uniref:HEAT repeat domain-containing protein n=1 Tax=Luteolibacter flavescens TaxID=1859460 RepID=A0ABT3FMI2_9BACT|nr:hypothetical protein [Luteolibacter flavescens]MCW1884786.1 hypothetical protein [Luteolibacter flavescens]
MSSKNSNLTLVGAIVVASAGAFVAGRMTAPDAAEIAAAENGSGSLSSKTSSRGGLGGESDAGSPRRSLAERAASAKGGSNLSGEEARAKMEALMRTTDPIERSKAWLEFVNSVTPGEFESVVASFRSLGMTESRMTEYSMLLSAWAKSDPLQALEYAKANTGNRFARNTILTTWAASDPEAAIRWAEQNHTAQEGEGNPWMIGVIQGLAANDPVRASQLLAGMNLSEERGEALGIMIPTILSQGPDAAKAWATAMTDESLREGAISRIADALAAKDPAGTAAWLMQNPGEAADRTMDDVITTWMEQDKDSAVAYYKGLPAGDMRSNALRGVANSMAMQDPRAAADFLDANAGDANDRVYEQFVWHSFGNAPEIAVNYIGKVSNANQQERMYGRMLDGWLRRDYNAASQWISQNSLPQNVSDRVQRRMQEMQQRQQ